MKQLSIVPIFALVLISLRIRDEIHRPVIHLHAVRSLEFIQKGRTLQESGSWADNM